jgi:hypothetical protein
MEGMIMVSPLRHFNKDPNGLGRPAGLYYHRGNGYFSAFSYDRDENRRSKGYDIDHIGFDVKKGTPSKLFPMVSDGQLSKSYQYLYKFDASKSKGRTTGVIGKRKV